MCGLDDFQHLKLAPPHRFMLEAELGDWHRTYLPPRGGVQGKNVLDLGAGCGETAQFYLNHGAALVRPVEKEPYAYNLLRENFASDPRISWDGPFRIDFIKSDCEGGEKDMVLETHFPVHIRPLPPSRITCPCSNTWRVEALDDAVHYGKVFRSWLMLRQLHAQLRHYMMKLP